MQCTFVEEASSFSNQDVMSIRRDQRVRGIFPLEGNVTKRDLIAVGDDIRDPTIASNIFSSLFTLREPATDF